MSHNNSFLDRVDACRKEIKETNVDEVKARMDKGESLILVDTREDREWDGGYIKGAIHIGKGVIERDIAKHVEDKDAEIILYCGGGFRSAIAAESLQKMGYTNVISMDGGVRAWKEKDYPMAID